MTTLTKAELAESLVEKIGMNKRDAKEFVDCLFEEMRTKLESSEAVKISGFGNFEVRKKRQRPGRNPKTGQIVPISARSVVTFKAGQKLKARVEHPEGEVTSSKDSDDDHLG